MTGAKREVLIDSIDILLVRTRAAVGTNEGSFLPTTAAYDQVAKLEQAKSVVPAPDDIARDFELIEPLNNVCRNAVVVHARVIDREVRASEIKRKVPTNESGAKMEQLQEILRDLGDERNLEDTLNRKRNGEQVEADPAQIDFTTEPAGSGVKDLGEVEGTVTKPSKK